MTNYTFDKDYLASSLNLFNSYLKNKKSQITEEEQNSLRQAKSMFDICLRAMDNENNVINNNKKLKLTTNSLLEKMYEDYCLIDPKLQDFICDLGDMTTRLLPLCYKYKQEHSIDDIVNNTLMVYTDYAEEYLPYVTRIIEHHPSLINFSNFCNVGSRCMFVRLLDNPFIIIEQYKEMPITFIHELQHAVEFKKNYTTNEFYKETGAITFETLYIDKMFKQNIPTCEYLYAHRLDESIRQLRYLNSYFKILKILSQYDFYVNKNQLANIFHSTDLLVFEDIPKYIFKIDTVSYLCYFLSFLKSIEIRNKFKESKNLGIQSLEEILNAEELNIPNCCLSAINLEEYFKEVKGKIISKKKF